MIETLKDQADLWNSLRELAFLRDLNDENVQQLAGLCSVVDFPKGATIFRVNEPASSCYFVAQGLVSLEVCGGAVGCKPVLTLGPGELLGWSPALGKDVLTATARTLEPSQMIVAGGEDLIELCERVPEFGLHFMRCVAVAIEKRLTATRLQLLDLYATGGSGGTKSVFQNS